MKTKTTQNLYEVSLIQPDTGKTYTVKVYAHNEQYAVETAKRFAIEQTELNLRWQVVTTKVASAT